MSGEVNGQRGPVESVTGLFMSWLDFQSGATFSERVPAGRGLMLYVVRGEVAVNGTPVRRRTMVEFGAEADRTVELTCEGEDVLVLFCHGEELREPVVAYGPFVMNTEDEIREAYAEYQAGKFGRV